MRKATHNESRPRISVRVHGKVYPSAEGALKSLHIPTNVLRWMRRELKASGKAVVEYRGKDHEFKIVRH